MDRTRETEKGIAREKTKEKAKEKANEEAKGPQQIGTGQRADGISQEASAAAAYIQNAGRWKTNPARIPRGIETAHKKMLSVSINIFVSPPPRRTPFVMMLFVAWKIMIKLIASISWFAIATASGLIPLEASFPA